LKNIKEKNLMDWNTIFEMLKASGPGGLIVGLLVLVFVYVGTFTDVFKTGVFKRWAAVLSSVLFAGVRPGEVESAITAAMGLAFATLAKLFVDIVWAQYTTFKNTRARANVTPPPPPAV
jgi:hypothetical protein